MEVNEYLKTHMSCIYHDLQRSLITDLLVSLHQLIYYCLFLWRWVMLHWASEDGVTNWRTTNLLRCLAPLLCSFSTHILIIRHARVIVWVKWQESMTRDWVSNCKVVAGFFPLTCSLMTLGLSKDIRCHASTSFQSLQSSEFSDQQVLLWWNLSCLLSDCNKVFWPLVNISQLQTRVQFIVLQSTDIYISWHCICHACVIMINLWPYFLSPTVLHTISLKWYIHGLHPNIHHQVLKLDMNWDEQHDSRGNANFLIIYPTTQILFCTIIRAIVIYCAR